MRSSDSQAYADPHAGTTSAGTVLGQAAGGCRGARASPAFPRVRAVLAARKEKRPGCACSPPACGLPGRHSLSNRPTPFETTPFAAIYPKVFTVHLRNYVLTWRVLTSKQAAAPHSPQRSLRSPYSSCCLASLFCALRKLIAPAFSRLRSLCRNLPGWGVPCLPQKPNGISPRESISAPENAKSAPGSYRRKRNSRAPQKAPCGLLS